MKARVTDEGLLIPRELLEGISKDGDEVEIVRESGRVVVVPAGEDPILYLGSDPVDDGATDASVNHDRYLYGG